MAEPQPDPTTSTLLAHAPRKGLARVCRSGCIHLTYGAVTLDFRRRHEFEALVAAVHRQRESGAPGEVHLRYSYATLHFSETQFQEFAGLVLEAARQLQELEVVQRLLSEPPAPDWRN